MNSQRWAGEVVIDAHDYGCKIDRRAMAQDRLLDGVCREVLPKLLNAGPTVVRLTSEERERYGTVFPGRETVLRVECELMAVQRMQVQMYETPALPAFNATRETRNPGLSYRLVATIKRLPAAIDRAEAWLEEQQRKQDIREAVRAQRVAARMSSPCPQNNSQTP